MLKLNDFATEKEIELLFDARIRKTRFMKDTKSVLDSVKKRYIYKKRQTSHSYKTRSPRFDLSELDSMLWREYLHREIHLNDRTTGDVAEELGLDLEDINKRI